MRADNGLSSFHPAPVLCPSYGASDRKSDRKQPYQDDRTKNPARATDARFFRQARGGKFPYTRTPSVLSSCFTSMYLIYR